MKRTKRCLPRRHRVSDTITIGMLAKTFPLQRVKTVLAATGRTSIRERDLPAHVMIYYVLAMSLYFQTCYREILRALQEGAQWLLGPEAACSVASKAGIS